MEVLSELKSQLVPNTEPSSAFLDEYGATIASWLLENSANQLDVETVIAEHLLSNDPLLDHCSWEIVPILCRQRWMHQSEVRSASVYRPQVPIIFRPNY